MKDLDTKHPIRTGMLRYDNRPENAKVEYKGPIYYQPKNGFDQLPPELPGTVLPKRQNHSNYGTPQSSQDPTYVAACWGFAIIFATVVFAGMFLLMGLPIGVVLLAAPVLVLISLGSA
jgi:hypothetical protein